MKAAIFRISQDPLDLIQPDWATQLSHALEFYNVTIEEEDEDARKINIPEKEGHHEVEGLQIENPNITVSLKMKQVNIGMETEPKLRRLEITGMMRWWIRSLNCSSNTKIFSLLSLCI